MPITRPSDFAFASGQHNGMTTRELFAALALQGILANPASIDDDDDDVAAAAVNAADALIRRLNRTAE